LSESPRQRDEVFFGWWMVLALFLILLNTGGMGFFVFPVMIGPLQREFGWTMTQVSTGLAIIIIVMTLFSPLAGVVVERFGVRRTMLIATMLISLCNLGFAAMQSLWMLYALMAVTGPLLACVTFLPAQTAVTNWFNEYRGRAMALAMLGPPAGGFVLPPLNEFIIRMWGWRTAWVVAAAVLWILVIPLIAFFVHTRPSDRGLVPDGTESAKEAKRLGTAVSSGLPLKPALNSQTFWLLAGVFVLQATCFSALNFHFVPFLEQEVKFSSQEAALYYGLTIGVSLLGGMLSGWLADRMRPEVILALTGLVMAIGPACLEIFLVRLGFHELRLLWLHVIPYGLGFGANAIIIPVLIGRCFGELDFARISGFMGLSFGLGSLVGILTAGYIFDQTKSYEIVLVACVVGALLSVGLALLIQPKRYHGEFVTITTDLPESDPQTMHQ
jgi:predicted MFS family arabinose efflux permease